MQFQHKMAVALLGILMSLLAPVAWASFLAEDSAVKTEYMQTEGVSEIYSLVGEQVIPVGELKPGQLIQVFPAAAEYYEIKFGNGIGFIDKNAVQLLKRQPKIKPAVPNNRLTNQNLITERPTQVYTSAKSDSEVLGVLAENLRYPIIGKRKDRLNNTWYEVNLGKRLGFVSSLDAEIDNGIPVLTYHHMLKSEENKRFRNTSTTTSDVAFSNQMTYLKKAGYGTLSLYQLEGYLKNQINLPAKAVVVTFDDGLKSVYRYAYPVLKAYGFRATAFVISSRIKRHPQKWNPDYLQFMSISELKEIQNVFDIQSHTHFLHRLNNKRQPILLSRSLHNLEFDLARSRRALEQFNPYVFFLAYPFGGYNPLGIEAAKNVGLQMAFTTVQGKVKPGDNLYTLKRLYILSTDSISTMAKRIANKSDSLDKTIYFNALEN